MTRIVKLREKEKSKYEQRNGVKLTYMPFITRAAIVALRKHPVVNGSVEGDAIRYNKNINIGIAVALDWGLIVPVLKQTEEKNFLGIARGIVDVADRARNKKLAPDEISGGTFTLTNSGIFGEQFGTPIINQPQSAILGIGGLNKEAEVITDKDGNDSIAIRSIQRFTLGFDHRIVDGADAGKFMSDFKAYLENWSRRHRLSAASASSTTIKRRFLNGAAAFSFDLRTSLSRPTGVLVVLSHRCEAGRTRVRPCNIRRDT